MSEQKKLSVKKLFLSTEERDFVRNEWNLLAHLRDLVLQNINNYLIDTAYLRLKVPKGAKVKLGEDASYIEIEEEAQDERGDNKR